MRTITLLDLDKVGAPHGGTIGLVPDIQLTRGVAELVHALGESAISLEMTLDFENLVKKDAVVFPGASDASLGFHCVHVDGIDVWWRQRLLLANGRSRLSVDVRPRRVVLSRIGRALSAVVDYRAQSA